MTTVAIIGVTGSLEVQRTILDLKPAATEVMGGASALFLWDLLRSASGRRSWKTGIRSC